MNKQEQLQIIRDTGIIAIMRANSPIHLLAAAKAIRAGGVKVIEVTMTTPGALDLVKTAVETFKGDVLFGAGSVLDAETARLAILSGAQFIVSPTLNLGLIELCNRYGVPVLPGCYTPTEALKAWESGADMIKLFPAGFGGPDLVRALLAPLPQLEIVPVGNVNLDNTSDFIRAGATAVGVGSSLINQALLDTGDGAQLTRLAAAFVSAVQDGR